jgi:nitrite reductase/ring-hydroxylating ferredoxin subunit/alkylhydroperoxidase/carboxymuconolactone decarboxylase family protein YurZ
MSDALDYLVQARPQAMKAYLTFLKESGKGLDPKTRALITVITKIATQTEKGLRQYVPKALHAGASPNEVLDAILHAFPALGLTKIIWAVDILLAMDLPEFRPENLGAEPIWHELLEVSKVAEDRAVRVEVGGRGLFVYKHKGEFAVYDSHCPHQATNIPELALAGERLTCPKHEWAFDLKSGACIDKGNRPLKRFETKVEAGKLYARW